MRLWKRLVGSKADYTTDRSNWNLSRYTSHSILYQGVGEQDRCASVYARGNETDVTDA